MEWQQRGLALDEPWWWNPSGSALHLDVGDLHAYEGDELLATQKLATAVAHQAEITRGTLRAFADNVIADKMGEGFDDLVFTWVGFHFNWIPPVPKNIGDPPNVNYFSTAKFYSEAVQIPIVLQHFAAMLEEILRDKKRYNDPAMNEWLELVEALQELLAAVDTLLSMLELPRRRVPRSALPGHARDPQPAFVRDVRDFLWARDLMNAAEHSWYVCSALAAVIGARRASQVQRSAAHVGGYASTTTTVYGSPSMLSAGYKSYPQRKALPASDTYTDSALSLARHVNAKSHTSASRPQHLYQPSYTHRPYSA